VIDDDKIVIVDEKTGRLMSSRSWSHGLHQAVEAKEGLPMSKPTKTTVKMSFQHFYRQYRHRCGMSGTFQNVKNELWEIYGLPVISIPRHLEPQHQLYPDCLYSNKKEKWQALVAQVEELRAMERPVLIGVRSISESEEASQQLMEAGISHQLLNAKSLSEEADVIATAGEAGAVTIATNMAGRGTDIKLPSLVAEKGGLHVIATERHESRRVDLQLFGRASRQGQPGSGIALLSLEDDLMQQHFSPSLLKRCQRWIHFTAMDKLLLLAYILLQQKSEWKSSWIRYKILIRDIDVQKLLSFARH
jgi:preprotein translocase subunit SecA